MLTCAHVPTSITGSGGPVGGQVRIIDTSVGKSHSGPWSHVDGEDVWGRDVDCLRYAQHIDENRKWGANKNLHVLQYPEIGYCINKTLNFSA